MYVLTSKSLRISHQHFWQIKTNLDTQNKGASFCINSISEKQMWMFDLLNAPTLPYTYPVIPISVIGLTSCQGQT